MHGTGVGVRDASPVDDATLAETLARSFHDDPVMEWLVPHAATRHRRLVRFYRAELGVSRRHGRVLTTPELSGGALWFAPSRWPTGRAEVVRTAPAMLGALRTRVRAGLALVTQMERRHPREPHWYLGILGTHPDHQGRGVGGALVSAVTEQCDAESTGAYLESSKASNVPYYRRFGFELTDEFTMPDGPTVWCMWREPR